MLSDVPAHVLRLDHMPTATALSKLGNASPTYFATSSDAPSRVRVILGLDGCDLCRGSRISPETGEACEVCAPHLLRPYRVIP